MMGETGLDILKANAVKIGTVEQAQLVTGSATVDASGGGTAESAAVGTVPAGAILLAVVALITEALDGDTTTTVEVGITGNTDKYIDPLDLDATTLSAQLSNIGGTNNDQKEPEYCAAATPIIATWTNTASMTAGAFKVFYVYAL